MIGVKDKNKVLYPELSYRIVGISFEVFNKLGYGLREKNYYKALEEVFSREGLKFKKQVSADLKFDGKKIGKYFLDYIIEDKVVLEIKVGNHYDKENIKQIYDYLKSTDLQLGILINFTSKGIKSKRILNIS